jgi:putative flavoprotein involved in K+ transport
MSVSRLTSQYQEVADMERLETIIVGAGQAGLATSYWLTQQMHEHLVLEQADRPAHVWHDERWDSFTLVTPNWANRMPGVSFSENDPDGFMPRREVTALFDRYVDQFRLPVRYNTRVMLIEPLEDGGYRVETDTGSLRAANVVIATGFFQQPRIPAWSTDLPPEVTQLHSSRYRNPASLPPGAVLVVGSAQSGCQIAEELYRQGWSVYLATGNVGRAPRRYRGRDVIAWLDLAGIFDTPPEELPPGLSKFGGIPQLTGVDGGHTINLHQFARDGVRLLGHLRGAEAGGNRLLFAPDLHANLATSDGFEQMVIQSIDQGIAASGLDVPSEELPQLRDGFDQPLVESLDLRASGVSTIIWATGFSFDYRLIKLPVTDNDGFPVQENGISQYPGLSFVGMPWMPGEKSGFLLGVGERAEEIASHIIESAHRPVRVG